MGVPQIIIIVLYSISLVIAANQHGKTIERKDNFWISLISVGVIIGLLIWGGFFS